MSDFAFVGPGGGEKIDFMGHLFLVKRSSDDFTFFVNEADPGNGAPMHIHDEMEENCFVIEGQIKARAGDQEVECGPGDYVHIAKGVPHAWKCIGDQRCRLIWVTLPGGYEEMFTAMNEAVGDGEPDMGNIAEVAARFNTRFVGPMPE
ncbi:MAG: cupin domain-containing protein [Chthonomonas sp.]|nr:cupin domain-containing protein [Chthonomonas sp.]